MKWVGVILLLACAVWTSGLQIDHDDLIQLLLGYFQGMKIQEDPFPLLNCMDDGVGTDWDQFATHIGTIRNWKDKATMLLATSKFIQPALLSLGMVQPCSRGDIYQIYVKVQELISHPEAFAKRIIDNLDILSSIYIQFLSQWRQQAYLKAGQTAGAAIDWIFLNQ